MWRSRIVWRTNTGQSCTGIMASLSVCSMFFCSTLLLWVLLVTYGHILNVGRSPTSRQTISSICCWKLIPLLELYPHRRVMVSSCSAGIPGCNSIVIGNSRMADGQLFPSRRLHLPSLGWCCCGSTDDNCVRLLRANPPILVAGSIVGLPHFGMIPNDERSNFYPKAGPLQSPSFGGTNGGTGQLACHGVSWYMFFRYLTQ